MSALNKEQVSKLYQAVSEGLTKLYEQSEAGGSHVAINPARTYFCALSGYLASNGVLDALNITAYYMTNPEDFPEPTHEKLPVM